jgi:hypothetical protein
MITLARSASEENRCLHNALIVQRKNHGSHGCSRIRSDWILSLHLFRISVSSVKSVVCFNRPSGLPGF